MNYCSFRQTLVLPYYIWYKKLGILKIMYSVVVQCCPVINDKNGAGIPMFVLNYYVYFV